MAAEVPARYAVPVQVRNNEGDLLSYLVADGKYHPVRPGGLTFIAVLPQGQAFQISAELRAGASARVTLQGEARITTALRGHHPTLPERQRTALRFYAQSSIDAYRRSALPKAAASMLTIDELRLQLGASSRKVQFIQLLSPGLLPINIAHAGEAVRLASLERTLAADLMIMDERIELAYEYLRYSQPDQAAKILDLQDIGSEGWLLRAKPAEALVCLHILLGVNARQQVEDVAVRLACIHPHISDFHIISAECAARRGDDTATLGHLAQLQDAGLPLLYRSYAQATVRLARYVPLTRDLAASGDKLSSASFDPQALLAVHKRLQGIKQYVDPASSLLVIRGPAPGKPTASLSWPRKLTVWFARIVSRHQLRFDKSRGRRFMTTSTGAPTSEVTPAPSKSQPVTVEATDRRTPSALALATAAVALLVWAAFAAYLLARSSATEVQWTRIAWVFSSVEAVAFAAAGLIFGTTVNRQRAQQAEAQANANQRDAEGGRALAAALKADQPPVVYEEPGTAGGPKPLGSARQEDAAIQVAARHARLARQLFP